jgi:hypothetical protein
MFGASSKPGNDPRKVFDNAFAPKPDDPSKVFGNEFVSKPEDDLWSPLLQTQEDFRKVFDNAFRPKPDDPWIQLIRTQEDPRKVFDNAFAPKPGDDPWSELLQPWSENKQTSHPCVKIPSCASDEPSSSASVETSSHANADIVPLPADNGIFRFTSLVCDIYKYFKALTCPCKRFKRA